MFFLMFTIGLVLIIIALVVTEIDVIEILPAYVKQHLIQYGILNEEIKRPSFFETIFSIFFSFINGIFTCFNVIDFDA